MSSKEDDFADGKRSYSGKYDDDDRTDYKDNYDRPQPPKIEIISIEFDPPSGPLNGPLELRIRFELDRDVVAGFWIVRFLVDSSDRRLIKKLGETAVEDYIEGDSEMFFSVDHIDVSGVSPSALANSGLLMAAFVADGEEVASVNMVVNVTKIGERFVREILSPLE